MSSDSPQPPILNYQNPGDSAYITLRTFPSEVEANMARHALEAIGITSQLQGEARHAGLGQYGAVSSGVDLQVSRNDFSAARKFLDLIDQRRADRQAKIIPIVHCPACNDTRIRAYHRPTLIVAVVLFLCVPFTTADLPIAAILIIAAIVAFIRSLTLRTCLHCGHVWKPDTDEETAEDIDDDLDDGDDDDEPNEPDDDDDEDGDHDDQDIAP